MAAVHYKREEQCGLINRLLDAVEQEARQIGRGKELYRETPINFLAAVLGPVLSAWLYTVKDEAFSSEHEWRLILPPGVDEAGHRDYGSVLFRHGRVGRTPYIVVGPEGEGGIELAKLRIVGVRCGTSIARKAVEHATKLYLKKHGFDEAASNVSSSTIPVRFP